MHEGETWDEENGSGDEGLFSDADSEQDDVYNDVNYRLLLINKRLEDKRAEKQAKTKKKKAPAKKRKRRRTPSPSPPPKRKKRQPTPPPDDSDSEGSSSDGEHSPDKYGTELRESRVMEENRIEERLRVMEERKREQQSLAYEFVWKGVLSTADIVDAYAGYGDRGFAMALNQDSQMKALVMSQVKDGSMQRKITSVMGSWGVPCLLVASFLSYRPEVMHYLSSKMTEWFSDIAGPAVFASASRTVETPPNTRPQ
jgi:hypothetical protein